MAIRTSGPTSAEYTLIEGAISIVEVSHAISATQEDKDVVEPKWTKPNPSIREVKEMRGVPSTPALSVRL